MLAFTFTALALATGAAAKSAWTTPHDKYSSSVGVLGCKINTDRVAYWPGSVDCDNICIKLTYKNRSVHLLRIDQSGGAYDISYDAWAYLQTGKPATEDPIAGGTVAMEYKEVDASECADLIYTDGAKIPLSASNSMNFLNSCLAQPNSYIAKNHVLYNICDPICTLGHDEVCKLDLAVSNQASCTHQLGVQTPLTSAPVFDVLYQTGKTVIAGSGEEASPQVKPVPEDDGETNEEPAPTPAPQPAPTAGGVFHEKTTEAPAVYATPSDIAVPPPINAPVPVDDEFDVDSTLAVVYVPEPTPSVFSTSSAAPVAPYPTANPTGSYNTTLAPVPSSKSGGGVGYTTLISTTSINRPTAPSSAPSESPVTAGAWRTTGSLVLAGVGMFAAFLL